MTLSLASFWELVETNDSFGGPRRRVRELLGAGLTDTLERLGILSRGGRADTYPCDRAYDDCPRIVITKGDGRITAFCGNAPPQCDELALTPEDAEFVGVDPVALLERVARALSLALKVDPVADLRGAYRVGSFIPAPGKKHPVFFVSRADERGYSEGVRAIRVHSVPHAFAVLVPTSRFISEALRREMDVAGLPVISLSEAVDVDSAGELRHTIDPFRVFGSIGGVNVSLPGTKPQVALAVVKERGQNCETRQLDEEELKGLIARAEAYDVFADETTRSIAKRTGSPKIQREVSGSYFALIREAVEARSDFDPQARVTEGDAKQAFQRARKAFDIGAGRSWRIFRTKIVGHSSLYRFDPDVSVSFAFIFTLKR